MQSRARTRFLTEVWSKYPAAEAGWLDVPDFNEAQKAEAVVCGRLSITDGSMKIFSAGSEIEFSFQSSDLKWLSPQKSPDTPSPELFTNGDILALDISRKGTKHTASGVLLLCPAPENESSPNRSANRFGVQESMRWAAFTDAIRNHFTSKKFIEVLTPTLVPSPGTEPFLDPFRTIWELGSKKIELFLPTSPEFHLKKLLSRGWTKIFEMKSCFRNGEIGEHHQPEFTMLEWYRAYSNLDAIAKDVEELLSDLAKRFRSSTVSVERTTMKKLFKEHLDFDLRPETSLEDLRALAAKSGIEISVDDTWNDVFFRVFLEKIERSLGLNAPCIVSGYPPSQAALSRIGRDGFSERFEVYWRGLEIANAFHELNDPSENRKRFNEDAIQKAELGKPGVPIDEELMTDLQSGMPPSGGIALGVDRLFMALFEINEIGNTRAFPLTRPC
ncbi:MAG: EF-P lysine aminoacylase EpmA [Bdellovibrionota bacterium]